MAYRLGLDLGTNSIGWAVVDITTLDRPELLDAGVRLFPDGRMPAKGGPVGEPLAVERRNARAARRQRDRRKRRQKLVLNLLDRSGYVPISREARREWLRGQDDDSFRVVIQSRRLGNRVFDVIAGILGKQSPEQSAKEEKLLGTNPYYLRSQALERALSKYELGRVLMHLALHRGFKSNRKADSSDAEASQQYEKIRNLKSEIASLGYETLGQYLWARHVAGDPVRFRPNQSTLYPDRQLYHDEFSAIRREQERHHENLDWDRIEELIYYQRPLHPQERGRCRYYPDEERTFVDMPSFTRFRYFQELRNLRYTDSHGQVLPLTPYQENKVLELIRRQKAVTFNKIRSLVDTTAKFNLESEKRDKLEGDIIGIAASRIIGDAWTSLSIEDQDRLVLALYESETNSILRERLTVLVPELSEDAAVQLGSIPLRRRTASVSARFARECTELMERERLTYDEAIRRLGFNHSNSGGDGSYDYLPYYGEALPNSTVSRHPNIVPVDQLSEEKHWGKLTNVTVHITLNQLRKVVNALIDRFGKPTEIVVELGRELKYPKGVVEEIIREQSQNQKTNERIRNELKSIGITNPTREDMLKYKLWEELGEDTVSRTCVYCGKTIGLSQLFGSDIEVEHILPKSRTLLNGRSNLTVAHRSCNQAKGNRTPYEAFHTNPGPFVYAEILARANRAFDRKKRENFGAPVLDRIPEVGEFLERQLTDNTYIARIATQYLSSICPKNKIWGTNGRLTAAARRKWGLDTLIANPATNTAEAVKNRADHRHHALDAIAIAFMSRGLIQRTARLSAASTSGRYHLDLEIPQSPVSRDSVLQLLRGVVPSIRQNHSHTGKLFKETAHGSHAFPDVERTPNNDGKLWAYRESITKLSLNDVRTGIVDPVLRKALVTHIEHSSGVKLEKALADFSEQTGVRRVRIIARSQSVLPVASAPFKAYAAADFLCCVVWQVPGPKGKTKFVPVYWTRSEVAAVAAGRTDFGARRPHPAAKKLHVLYKGDVVVLQDSRGEMLATVRGFSTSNNKIDLRPVYAADSVKGWVDDTNPQLVEWRLRVSPGQNYESINRIYTVFRVTLIAVSPDGRVLRR